MGEKYVLAIDQGTTGTKVLLVDKKRNICAESYYKHSQHYPHPGWVEHDPNEIWECIRNGVKEVLATGNVNPSDIAAVGVANQGETVMCWDERGEPLYSAIVWSCRRSHAIAERWQRDGDWGKRVSEKTGLRIDPYFSATKIRWMIDEVDAVKNRLSSGGVRFSTLDSWFIWKMSGGLVYATDASTAARTLLFNIHTGTWDSEILEYLGIEERWLPEIRPTIGHFGFTDPECFCGITAPIIVSVVDQPAALYGQLCVKPGMSKCTYGTGCFVYMNAGTEVPPVSSYGLLSSVVWKRGHEHTYALDGAVYSAGSAIEWGKDAIRLYRDLDELQTWSEKWLQQGLLTPKDKETFMRDHEVMFVPALSGLGTPYWDSEARGVFFGLSHHTDRGVMARAILEGIAHRIADVLEAMQETVGQPITVLKVDGGLTRNPYLMQYQADILGIPVQMTINQEATGLGVAYMLGEGLNWWTQEQLTQTNNLTKTYRPALTPDLRNLLRTRWKDRLRLCTHP